ncbi:hypothetical protein AAC387_Pa11g0875 [Persea americana]
MPYSMNLSFPTFASKGRRIYRTTRQTKRNLSPTICNCSSSSDGPDEDKRLNQSRLGRLPYTLLVERYDNGTMKRYILDDESQIQTVLEEHGPLLNGLQEENHDTELSWLPMILKEFILPAGFPGSVSEDYLDYMLLQFPTNVTGWICHTLVTSSLLKAVGVGTFSGTTAAASAAAIRWVSKDGLGAIGRLFIGGRFGNLFDDDPKQWRLYADIIGSAGSVFELSTPVYPAYFLPLASLGNFAKAIARGLKDPSFRVIQNHFATAGNLGEVAAKEEVWEVAAQLLGLVLGILIMDTPGLQKSYHMLVFTWLGMRLLHLWLRYQSLSVLRFTTINLKRARVLVKSHVLHSSVPGYADCNKEENILSWERFLKPRIYFGVSLDTMIVGESSGQTVKTLLTLYAKERYILVVNKCNQLKEMKVLVSFKSGATSLTALRSVWQAYWLNEHWGESDHVFVRLKESLLELEDRFDDFLNQLEGTGWDTHNINIKVPKQPFIEELSNS